MIGAGVLTLQEFAMREPLPLATIQDAVLEFLQEREDAVVTDAQAVNAYVKEPRMSQDIDLVSTHPAELAQELRNYLSDRFHIAVRVRKAGGSGGHRVYQIRKGGNRHLADVRHVETLPESRRVANVPVLTPEELIATKVISYHRRRGQPKSGTDWRDLAVLLLAFPKLKRPGGPVAQRLRARTQDPKILAVWAEWAAQEIQSPRDDDF
ncbi:MAG: nucleotidyl transferase AbiEii/AbiGii toxin family protein [Candidatus Hydrogenedentes bacterium]|nr:nucleotidyl transferase AbiEii/AbiGii toxin family protein [Candidatus Hydrogenedentota bacterium]